MHTEQREEVFDANDDFYNININTEMYNVENQYDIEADNSSEIITVPAGQLRFDEEILKNNIDDTPVADESEENDEYMQALEDLKLNSELFPHQDKSDNSHDNNSNEMYGNQFTDPIGDQNYPESDHK